MKTVLSMKNHKEYICKVWMELESIPLECLFPVEADSEFQPDFSCFLGNFIILSHRVRQFSRYSIIGLWPYTLEAGQHEVFVQGYPHIFR